MSELDDKLLDHDYDGIKELDNNLPRWWLGLFYFTIIWGVLYLIYFHVLHLGYSSQDQYLKEMDPNYVPASQTDGKLFGIIPTYVAPYTNLRGDPTPWTALQGSGKQTIVLLTSESDTATYQFLNDSAGLAAGADVFARNCVPCHGKNAEGGIGPNLTDDYWLHGATPTDIVKSVKYGYPAKGMISWRAFLKEDQILQVAEYVNSLRGSNPPNAKPPQGDLVTE